MTDATEYSAAIRDFVGEQTNSLKNPLFPGNVLILNPYGSVSETGRIEYDLSRLACRTNRLWT